eukprot:14344832-Alexandrium_andersonii.AAC.1
MVSSRFAGRARAKPCANSGERTSRQTSRATGHRRSLICAEATSPGHALEQRVCCTCGDWRQELIARASAVCWSAA